MADEPDDDTSRQPIGEAESGVEQGDDDAPTTDRLPSGVADLPRGTALGRYVILGRIGEGGMGVVYAAFDPDLDRKVAIKLLRLDEELEPQQLDERRLELLREAQSIAKVSHPCVVQVHDVGTFDNGVFVAMEFVDGIDLRRWMEARDDPFPWVEVVRVFREAGRGLAAAHAAGVVHRDFKPDNVLLGKKGRICVLDFGLARQVEEPDAPDLELELSGVRSRFPSLLTTQQDSIEQLTQIAAGTPAYMAAEQFVGAPADARSDQFAFCVAMYEALYGERPFAANRRSALALEVLNGRVRPEPPGSNVPGWLRKVLLRGLSPRPSDRYPTMEALLRDLDHDPVASRRRWGWGLAGLSVLAAGGAVLAYQADVESKLCRGGEEHLAGIWDPQRRHTLAQAFEATERDHAADAWKLVESEVDAWTDEWLAVWREACEATRVRGEASPGVHQAREACLMRRLDEVAALGHVLDGITASMLEDVHSAPTRLTTPRSCMQSDASSALLRPSAATADAPATIRPLHDEAWALHRAGADERAWTRAQTLARSLQTIEDPALHASTELLLGEVALALGQRALAEAHLHRAANLATAAELDRVLVRAWTGVAATLALDPSRFAEAERWATYATSAAERLRDEVLIARVESVRGDLARRAGRAGDALTLYHEALATTESVFGPSHLETAAVLTKLGILVATQGEYVSAQRYFRRALEIQQNTQGPKHPHVATAWTNLGNVLNHQARNDDAIAAFERALVIRQRAYGSDSAEVAVTRMGLADIHLEQARPELAVDQYVAAARAFETSGGPDDPGLAEALHGAGRARLESGQPDAARDDLERALAIRVADEPEGLATARTREALAEAMWASDHPQRALELARAARRAYARAGDEASDDLARLDEWLTRRHEP